MENTKLAKNWLLLAVSALALSGLFTILLIVARTTKAEYFLIRDMFTTSLIVHVNLGILVWLFSMIMAYFAYRQPQVDKIKKSAFYIAILGTVLITLSPFIGFGQAYQNNYIPIYDNTLFKLGIALFLASVFLNSAKNLSKNTEVLSCVLLVFISFSAFLASYIGIANKTSSHYMFELLFWGGGHVLQFLYTQIMIIAWLAILRVNRINEPFNRKWRNYILMAPVVFAGISTFYIYATQNVETAGYINYFTYQMIIGCGIAAVPFSFAMLGKLRDLQSYDKLCVLFSVLLFAAGGLLGNVAHARLMEGEVTTLIPSHYHGSVIAVTIALMGLGYRMVGLGYSRAAYIQMLIYSIGQVIYFAGLAILGQHGAPRKTPGIEGIDVNQMVYHFMHLGGTLALIGGIMFVVIILRQTAKQKVDKA